MGDKKFSLLVELQADTEKFKKGLSSAQSSASSFGKKVSGSVKGVMGSFTSMLGSMNPLTSAFGALTSIVPTIIGVFKGLLGAIRVVDAGFMATGIGAIIAVIAIALAGLVSWLKRTKDGADVMNKAFKGISTFINVVLDRLIYLGNAFKLLLQGQFTAAAAEARKAVAGITDEIKNEVKESNALADREAQLHKDKTKWITRERELERDISEARLIANDESKTQAEREKAVAKWQELVATKANEAIRLKKEELAIAQARADQSHNTYEDDEELAQLQADIIDLEKQRNDELRTNLRTSEKITNESEKQAKAKEDSLAAERKLIEQGNEELMNSITDDKAVPESRGSYNAFGDDSSMQLPDEEFTDMEDPLIEKMTKHLEVVGKLNEAFAEMGASLQDALSQGAQSFEEYEKMAVNAVKNVIAAQLAEAASAAITGAVKDVTKIPGGVFLIPAMAGLAAGLVKTAFNSLIPSFADGGIVSGETIARVGEYQGAKSNPEVIAPLNKLKSLIGSAGSEGEVRFRIEGTQLVGVLRNYDKQNKLMR